MRLKIYITLALCMLSYGSKNWAMKAKGKTRVTATEMRFLR
jgi:hypothetical protein